jgi:hypothetical protein
VNVPLWSYVVVQAILLGTALLAPAPVGVIASYLIGLTGTVVLTVSVLRRRPVPVAGWWLVVAGAWAVMLAAAAVAAFYGPRNDVAIEAVLPAVVAAGSFPLFAVGMARLSRSAKLAGWADVLDTIMTALAAYLLLWALLIASSVDRERLAVLGAAVFPVGVLLVSPSR